MVVTSQLRTGSVFKVGNDALVVQKILEFLLDGLTLIFGEDAAVLFVIAFVGAENITLRLRALAGKVRALRWTRRWQRARA